jgi:uncharacterized protein YqeY
MLRNRLSDALKEAMKAQDQCAVSTLRLILAALKDRDICVRGNGNQDGISDQDILELLQKMVRQRHDSIEQYTKGNRPELAKREGDEIEVIERFLPEPLDETDMRGAIEDVIGELDAKTIKDMGRVMGTLKERYPGRMDFGKVSAIVKQALV